VTVLDEFFAGDELALSKVISHIEDNGPELGRLLPLLYAKSGNAYRVGLTGPPGSGKSTLVDKLAEKYANEGKTVGIIAVDPSSPFTGGALLGDRIRMQNLIRFKEVFIRSMATRGSSGGLAASTGEVAMAMDAFGKDIILIETVGVGQVELDIAEACDTTVVVLVPESGDSIQALKAGLMEIADVFVVNKADRSGANRVVSELKMILDIKRKREEWQYPVIAAQAINDIGVDKLKSKMLEHREHIHSDDKYKLHHSNKIKSDLLRILEKSLKEYILERILSQNVLNNYVEAVISGKQNPYDIVGDIVKSLNQDKI
jgi:LAO/AO transport system kinase